MADMFKTPLAAWHEAHGAKMAPFAGWWMPIQYEGILAEH
ncbi:MAG: glycine cleavage system protein T, partial [Desulfovibrio sp.]|nr:glycine cleavage system protein T [Desulfovibrio sp.]